MRVLLTGASSGIGAETARILGERDHDVVLVARGREGLERVAATVRTRAVIAPADVTDLDQVREAVNRGIAELGGLDAVISNTGAAAYGQVREMPVEDLRRTIDVTLIGAVHLLMASLDELERTAGTFVATGSVAAMQPLPLMAAYTAAKHGLRGFLNTLRLELKATGSPVQVAMVHPGPVDTPFWDNVTPSSEMPPDIPVAYRAQDIAKAIVNVLERPRPEHVPGLAMRLALALRTFARPISDLGLVAVTRWILSQTSDRAPARGLYEPTGDGQSETSIDFHLGAWRERALEALRA